MCNTDEFLTNGSKEIIKQMCIERTNKYDIGLKKGCKRCPYRYRGNNPYMCCIFANVPRDWDWR